jgi:thymidylate kinase
MHAENGLKDRALVIELVGPWGAGKSALFRSLLRHDRMAKDAPCVWTLPTPLLIMGGVQMLTNILSLFRTAGRITWKEGRQLARLRALYQQLSWERRKGARFIVVDEGAAVILSWLRKSAHQAAYRLTPAPWWPRIVRQWAESVDIVVFLDASDPILSERIRTREQRHPLKESPDGELSKSLGRIRADYESVLADLARHPEPTVLAFRTDQTSIANITEQVLAAVHQRQHAN